MSTLHHASGIRGRSDERGFTLPELLVTIVVIGVVLAIASSSWQGVVEGRRAVSATNQLASDLRLAQSKASNQLTDYAVAKDPSSLVTGVLPPGDYYVVRIPPSGAPPSIATDVTPGNFEGGPR